MSDGKYVGGNVGIRLAQNILNRHIEKVDKLENKRKARFVFFFLSGAQQTFCSRIVNL